MKLTLLFTLIFLTGIQAQSDTSFTIDLFNINIKGDTMFVRNPSEKILFTKTFVNQTSFAADLDADGIEELIIIENYPLNEKYEYKLYIYCIIDSFYEAAIINSGYLEPYIQHADESDLDIIITGNHDFNYLNDGKADMYYPLFCWKFEDGKLIKDDNELYETYLNENNTITDMLDDYFQVNIRNCSSTLQVQNAIASVYVNYLSAGELIMAQQFLKNYYFCDDLISFKSKVDNLIKKEN